MPERIQLRRTAGWRKPEGAVVVSRPSRWGNPFKVGQILPNFWRVRDPHDAVRLFRSYAVERAQREPGWLEPLRGRDLACWCPLTHVCHANVLIELANAPAGVQG